MIIKTPSRLHMSLIDLNCSYGRIDGGIGLTLREPNFIIESEETEKGISIEFHKSIKNEEIIGRCTNKIKSTAEKTLTHFKSNSGFHFKVHSAYGPHSGLGSGTQMALGTGKLIAESLDYSLNATQLSSIVGRGGTSGVGTFCFEKWGFVIDGGHSLRDKSKHLPYSESNAEPPQLIGRYDIPEDWNVLVAIPKIHNPVSGQDEIDIFNKYCPVPKNEVEKVSHIILMNMIPFLLEKNIECFSKGIDAIQKVGFKNVEVRLQPKEITDLMNYMREMGAYGVGMSSFGPAIYTLYDKNNEDIVKATKEYLCDESTVFTTKVQNNGYELIK